MFRPCIDLHEGKVKQIVGGTLNGVAGSLRTNFVSEHSAGWYAELYRRDGLKGGHVILLGPDNEQAAQEALRAYPGGLQVGGGVNLENAPGWLDLGASHVIVTSWVFREGRIDFDRLTQLVAKIGRSRLVLDLSCRRRNDAYCVVTDRFQRFTEVVLGGDVLLKLAERCDEFLVHAVDVEGLCQGIDEELVGKLAVWSPIPVTYAGGAKSLTDLETVTRIGHGKIDLTIGSALDIFGGDGVRYEDVVRFNRDHAQAGRLRGERPETPGGGQPLSSPKAGGDSGP
jgi:phosphoribosylformimino-5-aminoimidazole carboxamide ribotide isomerase